MKCFALALGLLLLVFSNYAYSVQTEPESEMMPNVRRQDFEEVKSKLKELDKLSDPLKVKVAKGDIKSTSNKTLPDLMFKVEGKTNLPDAEKETLLELDLSNVEPLTDEQTDKMFEKLATTTAMCGTIPSVTLAQIGVSKNYVVQSPYTYTGSNFSLTVPAGTVYDRSSIPAVFWLLISQDDTGNVAPLIHDFLYRNGGKAPQISVSPYRTFSREETDGLFREIMLKCGAPAWRANGAYLAIRKAAAFAWKGPNP